MVKRVQVVPGHSTALVVIGWLSFLIGCSTSSIPYVSIPLLAIARVLP